MTKNKVLFSFVGSRDPFSDDEGNLGPVLSLLEVMDFDEVNLVWTDTRFYEKAKMVEQECLNRFPGPRFFYHPMELKHVIDYEEIYTRMTAISDRAKENYSRRPVQFYILLDPGTPQMQTCWFLLSRSGRFPATLLQGVPPKFTGGVYKVREVAPDDRVLPPIGVVEEPAAPYRTQPAAVTGSRTAAKVYEQAGHFARFDLSILILGESGSGKEVLARYIHERSPRSAGPFLPMNCAGLDNALLESTLFGHKKGAFTGAVTERPGCFKTAGGGTLFLDEIGDLPLGVQPKLLRVLEYKTFIPVGGSTEESADVRIICATNRDLKAMVAEGSFRQDLFQRLNQLPVTLPPLAERREDIPALITEFLEEWESLYRAKKNLSADTLQYLLDYPWPGNIRELKNEVLRMCAVSPGELIVPEHLSPDLLKHFDRQPVYAGISVDIPEDGIDLKALLFNIEKSYYGKSLEKTGGNREQAAFLLGLKPHTFRKALKERFDLQD